MMLLTVPFMNEGKKGFFCLFVTISLCLSGLYTTEAAPITQKECEEATPSSLIEFLRRIYNPDDFKLKYTRGPELENTNKLYAHYLMGVIFENQSMYENAASEFLNAQQYAAEEGFISLRRAVVYIKMRDYQKAKGCIDSALRLNPKDLKAHFLLAFLYIDQKDYKQASRQYEKIIEEDPHNILALSSLAELYLLGERIDEAIKVYERLMLEYEDQPPAAFLNIGLLYLKLGDEKTALEKFKYALSLNPDYIDALLAIGVLAELKKDYNQAIVYYRKAAEIRPENIKISLRIARAYLLKKDYENTKKEYHKIIEKEPQEIEAYLGLAEACFYNKENKAAISVLDDSLQINKEAPNTLLLLGIIYSEDRQYDKAIEYYKKVINLDHKYSVAYFYLGSCLERQGKRNEAKESLKKAIETNPDYTDALNYLGYMYAEDNENLDEAISLINRAIKIEPNNGAFIDSLGWAYYKKGEVEKAEELIEEAVRLYGDDPVIYDHLGDIYYKMGKYKKAKAVWMKSLKLDPEQDKLREKLNQIE